ncbi:hypothetical protein [Synechococcus sp. CC9616]|uniref:hypothetical protein n=1 Tax=Synechococcus sp. CC9616 TaxID=110663 RepID=UPI0004B31EC0|nr:hypothetical protein [Synechococcus sp. CC9616]
MNKTVLSPALLLLFALALPAGAAEKYVSWPSKNELRQIQIDAFSCSRENSESTCQSARRKADGLMDHPRLPGVCKDVLWKLMETAKVAPANTYKRRDEIDQPARRLTTICAEPIKKKDPKKQGGPQPNNGLGFGA